MNWAEIAAAAENLLMPVPGGFTAAKRGLVDIPGSGRVFVKLAVDDQTNGWMSKEIAAYEWLNGHNYGYAPQLIAHGKTGIALPDLSNLDWENRWTDAKLGSALVAMDALAELSDESHSFVRGAFADDLWSSVPESIDFSHLTVVGANVLAEAKMLTGNKSLLHRYTDLARQNPIKGDDLVHYDVRADNFAYNVVTGEGLLVDWNWLCKGSKKFDQTALLADIHKQFDVTKRYRDKIDMASLAYLIIYFLEHAARVEKDERSLRRRNFQLESGIVAHRLFQEIF